MNKKNAKKRSAVRLSKFEKLIYTTAIVSILVCPLVIVFSQATLSTLNYDVEKLSKDIAVQGRTNDSIQMMINELANLERVEEVAKASGLNISNENIKTANR